MRRHALIVVLLLGACSPADENTVLNVPANVTANAQSNATGSTADGGAPGPPQAPTTPGALESGFTLSAAPASAAAGATMTLTLRNGSRSQGGYNLCTSGLETAAGVPVASDRMCTMELRTLAPGTSATYAYEIPARLAGGSYRFVTNVERMNAGARTIVRSNNFEVR